MCVDTCSGAFLDLWFDMCVDMCVDMCLDIRSDMRSDIRSDMCFDTCVHMCLGMCLDMCLAVSCIQHAHVAVPSMPSGPVCDRAPDALGVGPHPAETGDSDREWCRQKCV